MKGTLQIIFAMAALLLCAACNPGVTYQPDKEWGKVSEGRWSKTYGQIDIETSDLGVSVGSAQLNPEISITNRSESNVIVESAVLKTGGAEYVAQSPDENKTSWEASPGERRRLFILWQFNDDRTINKVLSGHVKIILRIKSETEIFEVEIPFVEAV